MEFYIFDLKGVHWDKQTFSCEEHLVNAKACEEENIKKQKSRSIATQIIQKIEIVIIACVSYL